MYRLLLADSEVRQVTWRPSTMHPGAVLLAIELSAARVERHEQRAPALPGQAAPRRPTEGYLKPVTIWLEGARWSVSEEGATLGDCCGALAEGSVSLGATRLRAIDLPLLHQGPVILSLAMRARADWRFQANGIRIDQPLDARFTASLAC